MSAEQFEPGEIAIYVGDFEDWHGEHVLVLSALEYQWNCTEIRTGKDFSGMLHKIRPPADSEFDEIYVLPTELKKIRPPREDLGLVRWSECPWQPAVVNA